jgi:hypothetical protein
MQLSQTTLKLLKNFATINSNLFVEAGSTLTTISEAKSIMAMTKVTETFDSPFGIYDLGQFLSTIEMFKGDPELTFAESYVTISSGRSKSVYRYADPSILTKVTKKIEMPKGEFTVEITAEILDQIRKAASVFGHTVVSLEGEGGVINLTVLDPKNTGANTFSIVLYDDHAYKGTFNCHFLISNLKVIGGNYTVTVSSRNISEWVTTGTKYFIALEKTSSFAKA